MTTAIVSSQNTAICWTDVISYPETGFKSKLLLEDRNCRYTLMSLVTAMQIAEHANPRNATVNVIEGRGLLILDGKELVLESGVFIFIPANIRHAVKAISSISFLLILSENNVDSVSPLPLV